MSPTYYSFISLQISYNRYIRYIRGSIYYGSASLNSDSYRIITYVDLEIDNSIFLLLEPPSTDDSYMFNDSRPV